jgi:5-bromo-4-chloroindolyl phosphate hydrolysis protein
MKKIIVSFESLHEIYHILGVLHVGQYIPNIVLKIEPKSYYCCEDFYSTLIQGVVV